MYGIALTFTMLAALFVLSVASSTQQAGIAQRAYVDSLASNVAIYRVHAKKYLKLNATLTGSVSDASLGLPTWYGKREKMSFYADSGTGYVYLAGVDASQLADAADYLKQRNEYGRWGIKTSGKVVTSDGETVTVPAQVPDGSFVMIL